jgi:hypothetical protein
MIKQVKTFFGWLFLTDAYLDTLTSEQLYTRALGKTKGRAMFYQAEAAERDFQANMTRLDELLAKYQMSLAVTLDAAGLTPYDGEDLDTEDMDDLAPEEESAGQQDEFVGGIIILDPATTPEEEAELVEFYQSIGCKVEKR